MHGSPISENGRTASSNLSRVAWADCDESAEP